MRGGATEVNETQKWATSKRRLRTTVLDDVFTWECINTIFEACEKRCFNCMQYFRGLVCDDFIISKYTVEW
jgi:hypothetical protein